MKEHLLDFQQSLISKGSTERHAKERCDRIKRVFEGCGFVKWDDISASKVLKQISEIRKTFKTVETEKINGRKIKRKKVKYLGVISVKTKNYYISAVKHFCQWMVQDNRAGESPVEHLKPILLKGQRNVRRALEPDQLRGLLEVTKVADISFGMTGYQRATLYQIAAETGLKASELRSLKVSDLDFDNHVITIQAAYTKNRQLAEIHLKKETSKMLKDFTYGQLPSKELFNLPHPCSLSRMIRKDLEDANIKPEDTSNSKLDFHSLRHTFGTMLAAAGVHPKTAQDLMRHSDINLTMSRYTHTLRGQAQKAIESLTDLSLLSNQSQKATGTDNQPVDGAYKPAYKKLTENTYSELIQSSSIGIKTKGKD